MELVYMQNRFRIGTMIARKFFKKICKRSFHISNNKNLQFCVFSHKNNISIIWGPLIGVSLQYCIFFILNDSLGVVVAIPFVLLPMCTFKLSTWHGRTSIWYDLNCIYCISSSGGAFALNLLMKLIMTVNSKAPVSKNQYFE